MTCTTFADSGALQSVTDAIDLNFGNAITFKTTGAGDSTNDVVQKFLTGVYYPANPVD